MTRDALMERLRAADPIDREEAETWTGSPAARAQLECILAAPAPGQPRRAPRRGAALVALGAGGALAVAAAVWLGGGGASGPTYASAAEALDATAAAAAAAPQAPAPGRFLYVRTRSLRQEFTGEVAWLVPSTSEAWYGADGSLHSLTTDGRPRLASALDRARWLRAGRPRPPARTFKDDNQNGLFARARSIFRELGLRLPDGSRVTRPEQLPANPRALLAVLERSDRGVPHLPSPVAAIRTVAFVDGSSVALLVPARVRAGLLRALALLPGLRLERQGDGLATVSVTHGGLREELTLDPERGAMLAYRELIAGTGPRGRVRQNAGTVLEAWRILESRDVQNAGERP